MSNVIDLQNEREINAMINRIGQLIVANPDRAERDFEALDGKIQIMKNDDAGLLSVRVSKELLSSIDDAAREIAYREKRKVTRSTLVSEWLEASMKEYLKHKEQTL